MYSHGTSWDATRTGPLNNIYSACLQSLNVPVSDRPPKYRLVFQVDRANHGLLNYCGNVPLGCVDDCFSGVSIYELKPFEQQQPNRS